MIIVIFVLSLTSLKVKLLPVSTPTFPQKLKKIGVINCIKINNM